MNFLLFLFVCLLPTKIHAQENTALKDSLHAKGLQFFTTNHIDSAIIYFEKAIALYANKDSTRVLGTMTSLGRCYASKGRKEDALNIYQTTLRLAQKYGKTKGLGYLYNNMGILEEESGNFEKAKILYTKGLEASESVGNDKQSALCHESLGVLAVIQKDYTRGEQHLQKSLEIYERIGEHALLVSLTNNLGSIASIQKKDEEAMRWFEYSKKIAQSVHNLDAVLLNAGSISNILVGQGRLPEAIKILKNATPYLDSAQVLESKRDFYFAKATCYEKAKDWNEAYKAIVLYQIYKDSLFSSEQKDKIAELNTRFEVAEKDRSLLTHEATIQKQKTLQWLLTLILLGVSIFGFISWRAFQYKSKVNKVISFERKRSDALLLNILPPSIAEELKENGKVKPRIYEKTTVLCADFQSFTKISEDLSPESLVALLDEYFQGFDAITSKYDIEKIKTMGDAYMAVGGLPIASKGTPLQTTLCALEMAEFIVRLGHEKSLTKLPYLNCRIGLHTGTVIAGIVGKTKFVYDIWGDTVNTATRMEQNSITNAVNISETTWTEINSEIGLSFEERGYVDVKGKGQMKMFWVKKAGVFTV